MTEWIQEGYAAPEPPPPDPEEDVRDYGVAVPFPRAFAPMTLARIVERLLKSRPKTVAAYGLLLTLATQSRFIGMYIPISDFLDRAITGTLVGLPFRQLVLNMHMGIFLGAYVVTIICAQVAAWARGDAEDDFEVFLDFELGLQGVLYEAMALGVQVAVALPFFVGALLAAENEAPGLAVSLAWVAVVGSVVMWMATRPGLWAVAVDDLPLRYALVQSLVLPLRYPHILLALFGLSFAIMVVSFSLCGVPAILAMGTLQCAFAVSWVLFGSTDTEVDGSELLDKLVKVDRPVVL